MLSIKEVAFLKKLAIKYEIAELDNFIKIQEKKIKEENGKVAISIKEKRVQDKFYARGNKRIESFINTQRKKILECIRKGHIEEAKEKFKENVKELGKHNEKAVNDFLSVFTDKELQTLRKKEC